MLEFGVESGYSYGRLYEIVRISKYNLVEMGAYRRICS